MNSRNDTHPNIVFILIDDMGWKDLACYGSDFHETPNIDALARDGARFTNAYSACPVCSPARASILTGKYPVRVGVTDFIGSDARGRLLDAPYIHELPLSETSLASTLRTHGYRTWHVGKWHLGGEKTWPDRHGFDVNIGGCDWGLPRHGYYAPWGIPTLPESPEGTYLTNRLTDEAVALIENADDRPFFLNLWHYAVHVPIQTADPALVTQYRRKATDMGLDRLPAFEEGDCFPCEHKKDKRILRRLIQSDAAYAAMVEHLDSCVGRVIDALARTGKLDSTIIVFTSDNGGLATAEGSPTCNAPLSEGKGWMHDGGVREPLIVRAPWMIKAGTVVDEYVTSPDFYPTLLEMAGLPALPEQHEDGISFVPLLEGEKEFDRGPIFWHYPHYGNQGGTPGCAMRHGRYKLLRFFEDEHLELYDLESDPGEKTDLAAQEPDLTAAMAAQLSSWLAEIGALLPLPNPAFVPWRDADLGPRSDALSSRRADNTAAITRPRTFVESPLRPGYNDCDVYFGVDAEDFS